jgi:hypothetical protein
MDEESVSNNTDDLNNQDSFNDSTASDLVIDYRCSSLFQQVSKDLKARG